MEQLPQQLVNGLFTGSVYALFAVGYALIFGVLDILNLAHAAIFALGGLSALYLVQSVNLPIAAAFPAAVLLAGMLGILLDRVAFRPLRSRQDTHFSGLISSIAMATMFEALALGVFGARTVRFPNETLPSATFRIGNVTVTALQIGIVLTAIVLMAALTIFLNRSRTGKAVRAVAEDERAARLMGVNVDGTIALTFFISSALGGAAGILYGLYFDALSPDMGHAIELKGLAVIILGGMGSIPGAVIGGLALGVSEVLTVVVTGTSSLRDAVAFVVIFVILMVRPSGILGRGKQRSG